MDARATLRGMVVYLATATDKHSGTDDMIYVGVSGASGGREFPLDVPWHDDFERRSRAKYVLGEVWDEEALTGAVEPRDAHDGRNDPKLAFIGFDAIDRVYLRKQCGRRAVDDDAWELDEVTVTLYADGGRRRVFRCNTGTWLGTRYGAQIWLPEVESDDLSVSLRV